MVHVTKKCKKCLEAENIPLTDLLFYILEVLDPCSDKSSHLAMSVCTIKSEVWEVFANQSENFEISSTPFTVSNRHYL
jgi:hypothetical protein